MLYEYVFKIKVHILKKNEYELFKNYMSAIANQKICGNDKHFQYNYYYPKHCHKHSTKKLLRILNKNNIILFSTSKRY